MTMFQHQFQNGACVEVFSAQEKSPLTHWNVAGIKKLFDKEVKSFVYVLEGTAEKSKMQLPKNSKQGLALLQSFLVLQVYVPASKDFSLYLSVAEKGETRRRLALSTVYRETRVNPIHCQIPIGFIKRAMWLNLCVDMRSLMNDAWSEASFGSLEGITITGCCRLRRIFTMRRQAPDTTDDDEVYHIEVNTGVELESIPKHCLLPIEVDQLTQVANWLKVQRFENKSAQSEGKTATVSSSSNAAKHNIAVSNKATSHHSSVKTVDEKQNHSRSQTEITRELMHHNDRRTDEADGNESIPFVHPHPPQVPSSKPTRRKPRVKSAENDRTPAVDTESNSHSESRGTAEEGDESISDVINALKDNKLDLIHSRGDSQMYTFSSPPTVIGAPRIHVSPPASAGTSQNPVPDSPLQSVDKNSCVGDDSGTECELNSGQTRALSVSPARLDSDTERLYGAAENRLSPMLRQNVRRSSLREIPEDELRRSGGEKPYVFTKYQAPDDELSQSYEQQMLLDLKRDAAQSGDEMDDVDSGQHSSTLLGSRLRFGDDPETDSSDDDTSTFKSPKYFPKHRPSYDYQEEIANLGHRFLGSSSAGEWESPRIVSPFATSNSSCNRDTMEIPQLSMKMSEQSTNIPSQTDTSATGTQADDELDLLFDPQLQCFYDPRTCKYYKLKM